LLTRLVAFLLVVLHDGPRGHFLRAVAVAAGLLGRLLDVLVFALLFVAHAAQVLPLWHRSSLSSVIDERQLISLLSAQDGRAVRRERSPPRDTALARKRGSFLRGRYPFRRNSNRVSRAEIAGGRAHHSGEHRWRWLAAAPRGRARCALTASGSRQGRRRRRGRRTARDAGVDVRPGAG